MVGKGLSNLLGKQGHRSKRSCEKDIDRITKDDKQ